jgi:large subunit ribosomal protein L4
MNVKVYDIKGKEKGTTTLSDKVFNVLPNKSAIYYSLKTELANARYGTASTKSRNEVRGSGAKPYRQKGTGRARAGTRKSPIWTGGGTTFGPKPRSYRIRLPKRVKRLSIVSLLSHKMKEKLIKVIEDFSVESGKTKDFSNIASQLVDNDKRERVLILDKEPVPITKRAGRNIPWVRYYDANLLNTKDLYYATQLIITESAVKLLNKKYAK